MGYNTVVLILNDRMHELIGSPYTLAWAICHPPSVNSEEHLNKFWWPQVVSVAKERGEDVRAFRNAIEVLPTYHADDNHVLIAGGNNLIRPAYEDYTINKDRTKMTLKLPEWWRR